MNDMMKLALFALLGLALGGWHFASLRWLSRRLVGAGPGVPPWGRMALLQALRIALLVALFYAAVRQGALPLLGLAAGVLLARTLMLRRERRVLALQEMAP
jgi:hypothetical protein